MHSRVFQLTKTLKEIDTQIECVEDSDSIYEMMNGRADCVVESEDTIENDLKWLFYGLNGDSLFKEHKTKNGNSYIEIPYSTVQKYIEHWRKTKLENIKKVLSENLPNVMKYLETGKFKKKTSIGMDFHFIKEAIEDTTSFYFFDTERDYCIMTEDSAIYDYFETIKKGKSVYVLKSFDYHY